MKDKLERLLLSVNVEMSKSKDSLKTVVLIAVGIMMIAFGSKTIFNNLDSNHKQVTFDSIKTETELGIEEIKNMSVGETLLVNFYWNECEDCKKIEKKYVKALVSQKENSFIMFNVEEISEEQKKFMIKEIPDALYKAENKYLFETPTVAKVKKEVDGNYTIVEKNKGVSIGELKSILK